MEKSKDPRIGAKIIRLSDFQKAPLARVQRSKRTRYTDLGTLLRSIEKLEPFRISSPPKADWILFNVGEDTPPEVAGREMSDSQRRKNDWKFTIIAAISEVRETEINNGMGKKIRDAAGGVLGPEIDDIEMQVLRAIEKKAEELPEYIRATFKIHASRDYCLMAVLAVIEERGIKLIGNGGKPIAQEEAASYLNHAMDRLEVWERGYALIAEVHNEEPATGLQPSSILLVCADHEYKGKG